MTRQEQERKRRLQAKKAAYRKKVRKYILLGKNVGTRRRERGHKQKSNEKVNDYFERIVKEGYS